MAANLNGRSGIYSYDSFGGKSATSENRFLWWCAGAHQRLLRQFPSEHSKYSGLGGVLLATFVLAAAAGGYALYSVFEHLPAALLFGLIWGLIIFNFDRFLVSTMRKYGVSRTKQFWLAVPRIILAVLIGFTIARPLELRLFEKEIQVKVEENMHAKGLLNDSLVQVAHSARMETANQERSRLLQRKSAVEDTLYQLQQAYVREADGTGGSGRRGIEQLTRLKMEAYNQSAQQYQPELKLLATQIAVQDSILLNSKRIMAESGEQFRASLRSNIGFLERNKALSDLHDQESSVYWASLLLTLLIIIIETAPVVSKLIMQPGPYDVALGKEELLSMAASEDEIRREKALVYDHSSKIFDRKLELSEEYLNQLSDLQRRKIKKALDQWEKGLPVESTEDESLDELLKILKKQYSFSPENIL